ncbi:MAG: hypothetical protein LUG66_07930 [Clostridiales bacterium]|nr:hypothetical protein [Clostridiales bacterium]
MCNISYGIERRALNKGKEEGREETLVGTLRNLMGNLGVGIDQAMKIAGLDESEYPKYRRLVEG